MLSTAKLLFLKLRCSFKLRRSLCLRKAKPFFMKLRSSFTKSDKFSILGCGWTGFRLNLGCVVIRRLCQRSCGRRPPTPDRIENLENKTGSHDFDINSQKLEFHKIFVSIANFHQFLYGLHVEFMKGFSNHDLVRAFLEK